MPATLLDETPLLDFSSHRIRALITSRGWMALSQHDRIGAAYGFVRNEILFGYNAQDALPASRVLADGIGQCNTKATLLMALLRALGIPCRLHGFTIGKALQRGIVPELVYPIAPGDIVHSWVEIETGKGWINLEGFILDDGILGALQRHFPGRTSLCAYGAGTDCLQAPGVKWSGQDTYIQKTGINQDFGVFDSPDEFFARYPQKLGLIREWLYRYIVRHWMNARVKKLRAGQVPKIPGL